MANAKLTLVTAQVPNRLSKHFDLDANGNLQKLSGGNLSRGAVEIRSVATLEDFSAILTSLTTAQALVYGIPKNDASYIVTRRAFEKANHPDGFTTRTNDAFIWPEGPGIFMIDYDPAGDEVAPLDRDALVMAIRQAVPSLVNVAMLWWPSASSCLWTKDVELCGVRGQRLYMLARDAADIPRAGKILASKLWLAGFGRIAISKAGQMLERTLVDTSIWQTSHLDFAGGAACGQGLEQRRGQPVLIAGECQTVDTQSALPDLSAQELEALEVLKAKAKAAAKPEADVVYQMWVSERAKKLVSPTKLGDPETLQKAEATARAALISGHLNGDFQIDVEQEGVIETVTVSEILQNRDRWNGCKTRDPLEPDYDEGRLVGRLFLMQSQPALYSFAHGGRSYKLRRTTERIQIPGGRTHEAVERTIEKLRADPITFDFGDELVVVQNARVHALCKFSLANHLGSIVQYWKFDKYGKQYDADPSHNLLEQIIKKHGRRQLKPLAGVITGPTVRLDGSILMTPGYDYETRLLLDYMGEEPSHVPTKPSLTEANAALDCLMTPFCRFPFVDAYAKGALLASLLTAAVRSVLPTSPAFAFDAPVQGSGKTLLAKCLSAMIDGAAPAVFPPTNSSDDEETRKRLFATLKGGAKTLLWDNITGIMDSAAMAAFITSDVYTDRELGKSSAVQMPNRMLVLLTGNNLSLAGDLPRRVIMCRIDPQTDQPFAREFDLDPLQWVQAHRLEMLAAACTLIRARFAYARKLAKGRMASFEAWDDLVRQTVVWADTVLAPNTLGDPMDLVREAQGADPDSDALYALLLALKSEFDQGEFTASDIKYAAGSAGSVSPIAPVLKEIGGEKVFVSTQRIGKLLKQKKDRIVHGLRLRDRFDAHKKVRVYRVEEVSAGNAGVCG